MFTCDVHMSSENFNVNGQHEILQHKIHEQSANTSNIEGGLKGGFKGGLKGGFKGSFKGGLKGA